jgi:tape measure domain-containing protein
VSQEIGVAYVSLLPSGKGFSKGVQNEAESAFSSAEKSSNGFFSGLAKWAKRGAVAVGGIVAAVGTLAIGGGISRALNIEDATAKLKGLGHDTQAVEAIMKDALASVKGTAFGLDAAATTAASAVAAGIKPGQELERYLRLTADAATIAGTSMGEMGDIINQVTSKGYAGMENLNRLTERGIPIMQWLQKEYGVTADELQKMVSRGEVDAETFRRAIENNIGGAALESGNTTRGAFANMLASLSRLGEGFAGPALGAARDFFNEITKITDSVKSTLAPAFEDLQFWVDGLDFKFSDDVVGFLTPLLETINDISGAARDGSLATWFRSVASASPGLSVLMEAASSISPLVPLLRELGAKVGPELSMALGQIFDAVAPLIPILAETLAEAIVELAPEVTDLVVAVLPLIPPLLELVQLILPPLTELLSFLIPIVAAVASGLAMFLDAAVILSDWFYGDTTFSDMRDQIGQLTGPVGDFVQAAFNMQTAIATVLVWLSDAWQSVWAGISSVTTATSRTVTNAAAWLWGALNSIFGGGVSTVISTFSGLPRGIQSLFAGVGSWLVNSGRALMQGFIDGINSMIRNVGDAIGSVLDWAAGFFPHSPAKRGPFSGAGWTAVFDGGEALMAQFSAGAEAFRPEVSMGDLSGLLGGVSASPVPVSSPTEVNLYPTFQQQDPRLQMRQWAREAERAFAAS